MLKPRQIRSYLHCLQSIGMDPEAVIERTGVDWAAIEELRPISEQAISEISHRIAIRSPDRFSLFCAREIPPVHLGMMGHGLMNCHTAGDFLRFWEKYSEVGQHPLHGRLKLDGKDWCFELEPRFAMSDQSLRLCYESSVVGFSVLARNLFNRPDLMRCTDMPVSERKPEFYDGFNLGDLNLSADSLRFSGLRADLEARNVLADPEMLALCTSRCEEQLQHAKTPPLSASQRLIRLFGACDQFPSLDQAARSLGMSKRSLNRRLYEEGTSYRELGSGTRRKQAMRLLAQPGATIKQVSWELGFSDPRNFHRAFRAWTGVAISQWLESVASKDADGTLGPRTDHQREAS